MKDLIEKLKKNERPFGLCSKEEQECFERVGRGNCKCFDINKEWAELISGLCFGTCSTYRIKSNYQLKPEMKKYEVYTTSKTNTCWFYFDTLKEKQWSLSSAMNMPNFSHFELDNGTTFYTCGAVAKYVRQGYKVFACFVED